MLDMIGYWRPKAATEDADWEDGLAYDRASGWFAVADGASAGSNSREWAYTLTSRFVTDQPGAVFARGSEHAFAAWLDEVRAGFDPDGAQFDASRAPAWVQTMNREVGSFATFLGGRVADGRLDAVAVGDTCLFHVHADGRATSFPLADADEFGNTPDLVASKPDPDAPDAAHSPRRLGGPFGPRDRLFAATDALSHWILSDSDRPRLWEALTVIGHGGFAALCADLLTNGELKNDDVTLWRAVPPRPDRRAS